MLCVLVLNPLKNYVKLVLDCYLLCPVSTNVILNLRLLMIVESGHYAVSEGRERGNEAEVVFEEIIAESSKTGKHGMPRWLSG